MTNLKELEKKYEELGKEIERLKNQNIGFENDEIFLLSIEEYEKYKDKIPHINCWWWLRSPGDIQLSAADVDRDGSVYCYGVDVGIGRGCVRPALKINNLKSSNLKFINNNKLIYCGITWIKIDNNLYISEIPVTARRFDKNSNNYHTSEIRQFLLDWHEERKNW